MSCIECGEPPKYKCPTCRQPYCSVTCCKNHKEKPCSAPTPTVQEEQQENEEEPSYSYEIPPEDEVPPEKLKLLEKSSEVKKCLENPHVREILKQIDKASRPDQLLQEYMTEPIFTEFVDACLKVVQPEEDDDDDY